MKKNLFVLVWTLALLVTSQAYAQQQLSASSFGMGGAFTTIKSLDAPALLNPGSIEFDSCINAGTVYSRSYLLKELDRKVVFAVLPILQSNTISLAFEQQGFELYKRSRISLSYGRKFGKQIAAGIRYNHHLLNIAENYGRFNRKEISAGMLAQLTPQFSLGVLCTQPIAEIKKDPLEWSGNAEIRIGVGYKLSEVFSIHTDASQTQGADVTFFSGMNYKVASNFSIRTGIDWKQFNGGFGCSFMVKRFTFGVDAMYHRQLGFSPLVSIVFTAFK
jgi:hypothetical protein